MKILRTTFMAGICLFITACIPETPVSNPPANSTSSVNFVAWVGKDDSRVIFDQGASGIDFYRSRDANCNIANYNSCTLGQLDTIGDTAITDTALALNSDAYYVLKNGSKQSSSKNISSDTFSKRATRVVEFNGKFWMIGGGYSKEIWSSEDGNTWKLENASPLLPPFFRTPGTGL